ncbi:hypothetical protein [Marinobacterium iners]|uniref:Uncharacterized protein n=1 Tax=Marinobacterium iners DSM 11526 TaxID=1122198 RepID=A0A1H4A0M1_9GAMM|nr:hypothetical protein [Marinobacterium iners]SEA29368.1 hypothetical protein SAMN02745729_102228 [Marinobacterium iners DSM 11526]
MSWKDVIREHNCEPVVKLHCFTCSTDKYIENAKHEMTDSELDTLARRQGWEVEDGGKNGKCPFCVELDNGIHHLDIALYRAGMLDA